MDLKNRVGWQQDRGSDSFVASIPQGFQKESIIALAQEFREFPRNDHILQSDFTEIAE
jgi:hypothetical protein